MVMASVVLPGIRVYFLFAGLDSKQLGICFKQALRQAQHERNYSINMLR